MIFIQGYLSCYQIYLQVYSETMTQSIYIGDNYYVLELKIECSLYRKTLNLHKIFLLSVLVRVRSGGGRQREVVVVRPRAPRGARRDHARLVDLVHHGRCHICETLQITKMQSKTAWREDMSCLIVTTAAVTHLSIIIALNIMREFK